MKSLLNASKVVAIAALMGSLSTAAISASRTTFSNGQSYYGQVAPLNSSDRLVDVTGRRHINVDFGETITFRSNGQVFTWTFNGRFDRQAVRLSTIAPSNFTNSNLMIYIAPNPDLGG